MDRRTFIRTGTLALVSGFVAPSLAGGKPWGEASADPFLMAKLVAANDLAIEGILSRGAAKPVVQYYRGLSGDFAVLAAGYCHPASAYHRAGALTEAMGRILGLLLDLQYPNGTLDAEGNRFSPPDTAFLLETLCPAAGLLGKAGDAVPAHIVGDLEKFLRNVGEALCTGGLHTVNHRWVVSAALARLFVLFGEQRYLDRAEQWLAEGIYIDEDGNFPERSRNYAAVENQAFIHLAEILERPAYLDYVAQNLTANFYYLEPNGDLVCLDSRRQDQYRAISIYGYYRLYRYMANRRQDGFFAAIARRIEHLPRFRESVLAGSLIHFMDNAVLSQNMPGDSPLPERYTHLFSASQLARIRRGNITATIFGGTDRPLIVASGRSTNPTFFTFRKGEAILEYARLSTSFFNTGYFRSEGLNREGNSYLLRESRVASYYHPLPAEQRNPQGDYRLTESTDGRFWSKMDFPSRPTTDLHLETAIKISEDSGGFVLDVDVQGPANVEVTLVLCFRKGGIFKDINRGWEEDHYFLKGGMATYTVGRDTIEIGPGAMAHTHVQGIDGEIYSTHFGTLKDEGNHLYITGLVPFTHSLRIR